MGLSDKRCIITGASSGIGRETAKIFAKDGVHLILGARRLDRLEVLAEELKELGARSVNVYSLDVCSSSSVKVFCDEALSFGPPDILLNNAGMAIGVDHLSDGNIDDWQKIMDTNVYGVLRMLRAFLPAMKQNESGHLIMLGSIAGHAVYEGGAVYCASKFAVNAITKTLKLELNGTGIRVSSVDPGLVETEFSKVRLGDEAKAEAVYRGLEPLNATDIAECVHFIATRPKHVNIDGMIVMPTAQATVYKIHRN